MKYFKNIILIALMAHCLLSAAYAFTDKEAELFNGYYKEAHKFLEPYVLTYDAASKDSSTSKAKEDINKSIELFTKALEINPKSWEAYWSMGKAYQALGRIDKAYESFKAAYSISADNPDVVSEYVVVALEMDKKEEALSIAKKGSESFPKHVGLASNYALSLILNQQIDDAEAVAKEAYKLDSHDLVLEHILQLIDEVKTGKRSCPRSLVELDKIVK